MINTDVRRDRLKRYRCAAFLSRVENTEKLSLFNWRTMLDVPDFLLLSDTQRDGFFVIAACVFHALAIKRCIQGKKLKALKSILGEALFDAIVTGSLSTDTPRDVLIDRLPEEQAALANHLLGDGKFIAQAYLDSQFPGLEKILVDIDQAGADSAGRAQAANVIDRAWALFDSDIQTLGYSER